MIWYFFFGEDTMNCCLFGRTFSGLASQFMGHKPQALQNDRESLTQCAEINFAAQRS